MAGIGHLRKLLMRGVGLSRVPWESGRDATPAVLIVGEPQTALAAALPDWRFLAAPNLEQAQALLRRTEVPIVLCDQDAPGLDWRRALPALMDAPPRPCVVLLTKSRDCQLWDQVTAAGGYDILRKPLKAEALSGTLKAAFSQWRSARALEAARDQVT
jgi:DNA-binding NtrC family response regulator